LQEQLKATQDILSASLPDNFSFPFQTAGNGKPLAQIYQSKNAHKKSRMESIPSGFFVRLRLGALDSGLTP
jgi:hypothetical protein